MRVQFEINLRLVAMVSSYVLIGIFALHAAFPSLMDFWPKTSSDLAAWVQAVGSILALAVAIGIAAWERHAERFRESREDLRAKITRETYERENRLNVERFIAVADSVLAQVHHMSCQNLAVKDDIALMGAVLSEAIEIGRVIDLSALTPTQASTVLAARSVAAQALTSIRRCAEGSGHHAVHAIRPGLRHWSERFREIELAWSENRVINPANFKK